MDANSQDSPIFTVGELEFGWQEIRLAAQIWGEWQPFFEQTRHSLACLGAATRDNRLPSAGAVREAANAFRYAHNLISAEDANRWLARWQMSVEDWMNYLRAQLLRETCDQRLRDLLTTSPVSDEEVTGVIKNHAVCADRLRDWAVKLAGRAAIAARNCEAGELSASVSPHERIARIESAFECHRQQALTPKQIETKIADHRLDWIHFDCRYVWFGDKRIAREAAWCVSEDGLSIDEVADDACGIVQRWNFYLDEIAAPIRPQFLSARVGDWLGPLNLLEGFPLFSIVAKTLPAASDPEVRHRAEQAIVASFIEQAMNEGVRWAISS